MSTHQLRPAADAPARTTVAWVHAVADTGRLDLAWPLTDEPLRLALVQQWLLGAGRRFLAAGRRDEVAAALAAERPGHPGWERFAAWRVARWRAGWADLGVRRGWGVRARPQPAGADLEVVTLVRYRTGEQPDRTLELAPGERRVSVRFVMRVIGADTWRVAGFGARLPVPGWPPSEISIERTHPRCSAS